MRNLLLLHSIVIAAALDSGPSTAYADFMYNEAVQGDLSNDRLKPTLLVTDLGMNRLTGTVVTRPPPIGRDFDYFTVRIPAGLQLDSIVLSQYFGDNLSFFGMKAGSVFDINPADPEATIPPRLLGWTHFTAGLVGKDLFPMMAAKKPFEPAPVMGFSAPLPSGDYSFWVQETSGNQATYSLIFNTSVPEPSTFVLGAVATVLGSVYAARLRIRRKCQSTA